MKIFNLKRNNLKLRIDIEKYHIYTSWKHEGKYDFTNKRKFNIDDKLFVLSTLEPVLTSKEKQEVSDYVYNSNKGINEQLSLF